MSGVSGERRAGSAGRLHVQFKHPGGIMSDNPFAAPQFGADLAPQANVASDDVEAIRRKYLQHETSVKSIAWLYYFGVAVIVLAVGALTYYAAIDRILLRDYALSLGIAIVSAVIAVVLAIGLRRLDGRFRIPVAIFAGFNMLSLNPFAILVNACIMYLVLCEKGRYVLSPEYKEIVRQTPHIRYRTRPGAWIALGIVTFLLIVVFISILRG